MDEATYPDRLFACLLRQKEEHGSEFDENCSRILVQRLRVRALGLVLCVCLSLGLFIFCYNRSL